jgi:hypothetical protein
VSRGYRDDAPNLRAFQPELSERRCRRARNGRLSFIELASTTQLAKKGFAESVTPFNRMLQMGAAYLQWNPTFPAGIAALNTEVTRQASIIAYSNDFRFFFLTLPTAVLALFMRPTPAPNGRRQTRTTFKTSDQM